MGKEYHSHQWYLNIQLIIGVLTNQKKGVKKNFIVTFIPSISKVVLVSK